MSDEVRKTIAAPQYWFQKLMELRFSAPENDYATQSLANRIADEIHEANERLEWRDKLVMDGSLSAKQIVSRYRARVTRERL